MIIVRELRSNVKQRFDKCLTKCHVWNMARKTERLAFRARAGVTVALQKAATVADETPSALAEKILADWLTKGGWLKAVKKRKAAVK